MIQGSLTLHTTPEAAPWTLEPIASPAGRELADRHYSRQTPGARGYTPPGRRFLLRCADERGSAIWSACHNLFKGVRRWRNTIFRNESAMLSSNLVLSATVATYAEWIVRYRKLPAEPLTTEIDVLATAARRSRHSQPGKCYLVAGWTSVREMPAAHGRSLKHLLQAPPMDRALELARAA